MSFQGFFQEISSSKICHSPDQLRRNLENIDELANSIRKHGMLQPILVRPVQHEFQVVAGNRRLAAVRMLRMRKVACHVVELSDREAFEVALVENVQHKTMSPIEEALAFRQYVELRGWGGVSELAERIEKSQEFVTKRIQLLRLPEKIQQEIIRQRITPSTALEMLPLEKKECEEVAEILVDKHLTRDDIRSLIKISRRISERDLESGSAVKQAREIYLVDKALRKSIAVMKSTLVNFDDIVNNVGDDWVVQELLMQYRLIIHGDIDTFLKLRKRLGMKMPRGYFSIINSETKAVQPNDTKDPEDAIHLWSTRGIWQ